MNFILFTFIISMRKVFNQLKLLKYELGFIPSS